MAKENKYKRLVGNSLLFAVGNFGSKLISFVMLPLYTWKLSQGDLGASDLVLTTVSLLLPVFSLNVFDSLLRFLLEPQYERKSIFTNSTVVSTLGAILLLLGIPIVKLFDVDYGIYIILILINQIYQSLFSQYAKAIDKIKIYAINGILLSFLTAGLNILMLVYLDLGVEGYLLSVLVAYLVSNIWLITVLKLYREFNVSYASKAETLLLLKYSIPLIPNSIAWWITNAISRYFILFFLGTSSNGIFAVSNKIPSLLNVLNSIFFQAWQLSAIEEYSSKDSEKFYSKVFGMYSEFLFLGTSAILVILKPMINILVSNEFFISWKYVPFLLLGVVYSSFASFLGHNYAAAKKTSNVFVTTILSAAINVILNWILIPRLGLMGASISSAVSYLVLWVIRQYDTKKYVETSIDLKNIIANHTILAGQIFLLYNLANIQLIFAEVILFCVVMVINRRTIIEILQLGRQKLGMR